MSPAETRSQQNRVDQHEEQIQQLQSDVLEIKTSVQAIETEMKSEAEFHKFVMAWVAKQDKQPVRKGGSDILSAAINSATPSSRAPPVLHGDHSSPPIHSEHLPWAVKKVKMPEFSGFDPQGWIQKAELYFDINNTPVDLRIRLAQLSMTGVAVHWFTIVKQVYDDITWNQFTKELLQRFSGLEIQNPFEKLATIKQVSSIHDYIDEFEYLLSLVPRLPEEQSLGYFLAGLRDEVKQWVRLHRPKSRLEAMYLAKDVEEMIRPTEGSNSQFRFRYHTGPGPGMNFGGLERATPLGRPEARLPQPNSFLAKPPASPTETKKPYPNFRPPVSASTEFGNLFNRNRGIRSLTRSEWDDRRKKGLCFRCGQQFAPGHKCPEGKLRILLLGDDELADSEGEAHNMEFSDEQEGLDNENLPTGSCNSLEFMGADSGGNSGGKTLKFEGSISGIPLVILVDSGATHNFISQQLVTSLGFPVVVIPGIRIQLGDGHRVLVTRVCPNLKVMIGPCEFTVNALLFDMGHLDLVLGMEWLTTLGDVVHNWERQSMRFMFNGVSVFIQGMSGSRRVQASLQTWLSLNGRAKVFPVSNSVTEKRQPSPSLSISQTKELHVLFDRFNSVFADPKGLPPSRTHDHGITLLSPQEPVCVRPYRYPHVQKEEIEKQVKELLALGMIRPSRSAFSSPVILVKKKDNSWRMCVDYRALNKATVSDKFPISVVEELLDELKGARFFSKLDLKSGYNQIRMKSDSIEKTAFRTHDGHYEYLVMPFGLTIAPATFQAVMNDIFRPILRKSVVVFFDDILVYSNSWSQHMADLTRVL